MHLDIDRFAGYDSPLHNWDARFRIASLFLLIITISLAGNPSALAFSALAVTVILLLSAIPLKKIAKTLIVPVIFLIPLFIILPLTSGGTPYHISVIRVYEEGAALSMKIGIKALSIITLFILMTGTSPFNTTLKALRSLRVPDIMADIILFTYRYIHLYINELRTLKLSLVLRGYRHAGTLRGFRASAHIVGTLLVRSFEQTERIYNAMTCRGYPGKVNNDKHFKAGPADLAKSAVIILTAAAVVLLNIYP